MIFCGQASFFLIQEADFLKILPDQPSAQFSRPAWHEKVATLPQLLQGFVFSIKHKKAADSPVLWFSILILNIALLAVGCTGNWARLGRRQHSAWTKVAPRCKMMWGDVVPCVPQGFEIQIGINFFQQSWVFQVLCIK